MGFKRKEWRDIKKMETGTIERTITDNTLSGSPWERTFTYHGTFDRCGREKDYETVWKTFEQRI